MHVSQQRFTLLILEDSIPLLRVMRDFFTERGFIVLGTGTATHARKILVDTNVDLGLIDLNLPDLHGLEFVRELRLAGHLFPIIIVTGSTNRRDRRRTFELGASLFHTKPIDFQLLLSQVHSLLQINHSTQQRIEMCGMILDKMFNTLSYNGRVVELAPYEVAIFEQILANPRLVIRNSQFMSKDGIPYSGKTRDSIVSKLRKKLRLLSPDLYLRNIRGFGFHLTCGKKN